MTNLDLGLRGEVLELRIFVPGRPSSPNRRNRASWYADAAKIAAARRDAKRVTLDAINRSGRSDFYPLPAAEASFVFHLAREAGDLDNLLAGCKPIIDGLVDAGALPGDSIRYLRPISIDYRKAVGIEGVEIVLRERR